MNHSAGRKERRRLERNNRRAQGRAYSKAHNYYMSHPAAWRNKVNKLRKEKAEEFMKKQIEEDLNAKDVTRT